MSVNTLVLLRFYLQSCRWMLDWRDAVFFGTAADCTFWMWPTCSFFKSRQYHQWGNTLSTAHFFSAVTFWIVIPHIWFDVQFDQIPRMSRTLQKYTVTVVVPVQYGDFSKIRGPAAASRPPNFYVYKIIFEKIKPSNINSIKICNCHYKHRSLIKFC